MPTDQQREARNARRREQRRTDERQSMIRHAHTLQGIYGGDRDVTDDLVAERANSLYSGYLKDDPITVAEVPAALAREEEQ
ncbi:hypothetical protein OHB39_06310 [Streptomyces sp. NBC_00047]|uniref:hypothetical protein n=1 Tax=Streptomyces sp. NBC_00047 TaxID=2975627 RepID=UPI00225942C6|nr:hypothetical protein [Streptomyces sp. NBC_00047]MCX5607196.1 hypothetical protein [Streptomyces sp. NBC_00047]